MNKELLVKWLKDNNYRKMTAEEIIYEIESGYFDKEVTPCKNATPATTE